MTDTTATGDETTESDVKTPEEVAAEQAEAEAGFTAGFKKIHPDKTTEDSPAQADEDTAVKEDKKEPVVTPIVTETEADKAAKVEAAKQAAQDKFYDELPEKIRKLEGNVGGMFNKLNSVLEIAKTKGSGEVPTERQITQALKDPKAMEKLVKDYEDFKPVQDELQYLQSQMSKFVTADQVLQQVEDRNVKLREVIALDTRHPGWESVINTDEFITHVLQGGPTKEEYSRYNKLLNSKVPADQAAATKIEQQWSYQHAKWWGEVGADYIGGTVDKSIQILDEFKASRETSTTANDTAKKKEKRLKGAITPQGSGAAVTTGINDDEAFSRGFNKVHKHR